MKRCLVCGNVEEDSNVYCSSCGSALPTETPQGAAPAENAEDDEEYEIVYEEVEEEDDGSSEAANEAPEQEQPARYQKSEPQIYGQAENNVNPAAYAQGAVRRDFNPNQRQGYPQQGGYPGNQIPRQGYPQGPQARGPMGRPMMNPAVKNKKVQEAARSMLKSPIFFLIALFNTAALVGNVMTVFLNQMNYSQAVKLIQSADLPAQLSGYANSLVTLLNQMDNGANMLIPNLLVYLPSLLFAVGLWLVFFCALAANENMSGAGFLFMKIDIIITMIFSFLCILAVLILFVAITVAAWVSGTQSTFVAAVVLLVVAIIISMMIIMYYFAFLGTLKTCRINGDSGEEYGKASRYVAVIKIIVGLTAIITILSGVVNNELASIIAGAGTLLWSVLFGLWIFMYRSKLEETE